MQRPEVTLVFAQSLDGRIALPGARTELSSRAGLELAHRCRAENDALLVGSSTVKIDDPQMTVRYVSGSDPKRIVLASRLDIPTTARLFAKGPGLLLIGTNGVDRERVVAMRQAGAEVRLVNAEPDGNVSLGDALEVIASWGVRRLLVEGGARVLSSFLQQRLADRVVVEIVPKFLGAAGIACTSHLFVGRIDESPGLTEVSVENIGSSFVLRGRVARQGALLESASFAVGREQSSVSA